MEPVVTTSVVGIKLEHAVNGIRDLFVQELGSYGHESLAAAIISTQNNNSRLKKLAKLLVKARNLQQDFNSTIS